MNVERMLELADMIEHGTLGGVEFNMACWVTPKWNMEFGIWCGSLCCIAGHAVVRWASEAEKQLVAWRPGSALHIARDLLGLDYGQSMRLFLNECLYVAPLPGYPVNDISYITKEQAVFAIRRMVREEGGVPEPVQVKEAAPAEELVAV